MTAAVNVASLGTAMVADSSGNVGIGTSSPSEKVTSSNGFLSTGAVSSTARDGTIVDYQLGVASRFIAGRAGGNYATWQALVAGASGITKRYELEFDGSARWYAADGTTERARIDSSGNLLVGTTASVPTADGISLYVGTNNYQIIIGHSSSTPSGNSFASFRYNNVAIGSITQNGTTAVAYNTSSDYRLKENIAPMIGALATVAALKPVIYKWKSDGSDGQGFIAHELAEVVPDCVTGVKDAVETYTDEDGNEQTRPKYQGIDTSFLVATLTAAIQEQQALITQLQADVAELKGRP